jgi:hypothetical protein
MTAIRFQSWTGGDRAPEILRVIVVWVIVDMGVGSHRARNRAEEGVGAAGESVPVTCSAAALAGLLTLIALAMEFAHSETDKAREFDA